MNNKIITKSRLNIQPPNKIIFMIISIGVVVGIGGVFGYSYLEDQQKQLQSKLDTEQKNTQQLESQKKQEELKAQQVQLQLQQQAKQKQVELDQKQQELQQQQQLLLQQQHLQKAQQDIANFKQQQAQQQQAQLQAQLQQQAQQEQIQQEQSQQQALQQAQQLQDQQQQSQQQQQQAQIQQEKQNYITYAQSNAVISGLIKGYINFYVEPLPSYADPSIQQGINNDLSVLDGHTIVGLPVHRVYDSSQADIYISWIKDYGTTTLGHTVFGKLIEVGLGTQNCVGIWQPFSSWTVEKILWHELGHSFGYSHSTDPNNIMFATQETNFIPSVENSLCQEASISNPNMSWDQNFWSMTSQQYTQIWNIFHNSS
ncbi:MAG: matrixin family metalloprotease [Thaumarchaeota archaeon]|nr:matrixin family metalloprotease [Nitrososphaerota archaeon]